MVEGAMALTDLSESGCFIATTEEVPVGVEVRLQVMMAGSEVPLIGRVVRVQPRRGFAVEIDLAALSEQSRQALEQFLASAN